MKTNIMVSVIIPTYDRPDFLKNAIESALNQTYNNIEVIVVDDNNPNTEARHQTEKLMKEYIENKKVKYIKHKINKNGSAARNTGIKHAAGKYIALLDDDDEFKPQKIERQLHKLEGLDSTWGICYTKFIRRKNGKLIDRGIETREGNIALEVLEGAMFISAGSNLMIRKDIVMQIEGFNESFLRRQDLEFLIRASQITKVACVPEICLIINKDDRKNMLSESQLIQNTDEFLFFFDNYIKKLDGDEQKKVIIAQNLNLIRYYLFRGRLLKVYAVCKENKVSLGLFIKYLLYLVKRKVFKQCYGFVIE